MTPRKPRTTDKPAKPAPDPAEAAVDAYLDGRKVNPAKRALAVDRHRQTLAAHGGDAPLDWFTRQMIDPARSVL